MTENAMDAVREFLENFNNVPSEVWKEIRRYEGYADNWMEVADKLNKACVDLQLPIPVGTPTIEVLEPVLDMAWRYKENSK